MEWLGHGIQSAISSSKWSYLLYFEVHSGKVQSKLNNWEAKQLSLAGDDRINWIGTSTGSFSVKSAYRSLRESFWHTKDKWWKEGYRPTWSYLLCRHGNEGSIHILRDCSIARGVWLQVVLVEIQSMFFAGNWIQLYTDGSVKMDVGVAAVGEKGYQKVMIHVDHLEVGKAIQDVHLAYSSSALLRKIHMSLQVIQHWKIKHITKERNQVADHIVKMATIRSTVMQ
ncbi:hypothetical protein Goshw_010932, partial [Gossypium schwendimanii]|nr:hypothetical protein [Gossypium schwendimanii]